MTWYTTAVITGTPKVIVGICRNSKKGRSIFPCYFGGKKLASNLRMENNANCLKRIEICANYFCSFPRKLTKVVSANFLTY